jgi:hypothetical protein
MPVVARLIVGLPATPLALPTDIGLVPTIVLPEIVPELPTTIPVRLDKSAILFNAVTFAVKATPPI